MLTRVNGDAGPAQGPAGLGVSFRNSSGLALAGELRVPDGAGPFPAVVIASRTGTRHCPDGRALAPALLAEGLAAFLFDRTGCGDSEGSPEQGTAAQEVDDIACAVGALASFDEVAAGRLALAGIGQAGAAALAAARGAPIRAVVLFAAGGPPVPVGKPPVELPVLRVDDAGELALAAAWLRKRLA